MKLKQLISLSKSNLQKSNIEDFNLKIKLLIEYVFDIKKEQIILNYDREIDEDKVLEFNNLLEKVKNGVPVQYIINKQEFMGLNFYVDENVLIPQPDTEILVEEVIKLASKPRINNKNAKFVPELQAKFLDLCTGSGAIAVSIAKYVPNSIIFASDISKQALEIARQNDNENKVNFVHSNLFENIDGEFNVIVSNPPYIKTSEIQRLSKEVQNEPLLALDGGQDGLLFYREIIKQAHKYLEEQGYLCIEIGEDQKEQVITLINNCSYYKNIQAFKDLSGHDRVIICEKNKSEKS